MVKKEVLLKIKQIKNAHIKWYSYAEALVNGFETESDKFPKAYTDCDFGKWYYGEGQYLFFFENFIKLESIHLKLHEEYINIYKMQHIPKKAFNLRYSSKIKSQEKIKESLAKLKRQSDLLRETFDKLEDEIRYFDYKLFAEKYGEL